MSKGGTVIQQESDFVGFIVCVFVCFQSVFNVFLCNDVIIYNLIHIFFYHFWIPFRILFACFNS